MLDSADELVRKIQLGEDSILELKSIRFRGSKVEGPARNDFADELAAMANTLDGVCVLGIEDKTREIEGIPIEKLDSVEDFVCEVCDDVIKPPLSVKIIRMEIPDSFGVMRPIIKVDVPRSLFVHESPGGYFTRQGSSKRKLPPDLLARLFQQRSQARIISFDEQPVPETTLDDLEEARWTRFIPSGSTDRVSTLRKLTLLTNDDAGVERATVAAVALCSSHPETWLPGAYVEAVKYQGSRQDSNYQVDASRITGSLDEQVAGALSFVRRNMKIAAVKTPARIEVPQFSERAVFEAVVNAVAHRDYSIHGSKIRLFVFDNRLEIYSPGPLPNTVTVESIHLRQATRNELITTLLARCPVGSESLGVGRRYLMEKRGDGVPIILDESYKLSGKRPKYRLIDDAELLLTIYAAGHPDEGKNG